MRPHQVNIISPRINTLIQQLLQNIINITNLLNRISIKLINLIKPICYLIICINFLLFQNISFIIFQRHGLFVQFIAEFFNVHLLGVEFDLVVVEAGVFCEVVEVGFAGWEGGGFEVVG